MSLTRNDLRLLLALLLAGAAVFAAVEAFGSERPWPGSPAGIASTGLPGPDGAASARRLAAPRRAAAAWKRAADRAAGMSVPELVGQRIMGSFREATSPPPAFVAAIGAGRIGGVLLFSDNVPDSRPGAYRALAGRLQAIARAARRPALLIATDQESAAVARVTGPPQLDAAAIGRLPERRVRELGRRTGRLLRRAGMQVDLAPVADVSRGPESFMDERTFSRDWRVVGRTARAFAIGIQSQGVAATAKHYPGIGAATTSTDSGPASLAVPKPEARRDLAPFAALVEAGVKLVMMSSAVHSPGRGRPAVLEPELVASLREIGFKGTIVSDALDAGALTPYGDDAAVEAARAGVDLLLWGREDGSRAFEALVADTGRDPARIAAMRAAATRVLFLKEWASAQRQVAVGPG